MRFLFILFSLVFLPTSSFTQKKSNTFIQAKVFLKNKETQKAKNLIFKLYKQDSLSIKYSIFLGKIYAKEFKKDSSLYWLDKAKKLINPKTSPINLFQYYLWKGFTYEVNKNYDKALQNYFLAKKNIKNYTTIPDINLLYQRVLLIYSENDHTDKVNHWITTYTKIKDSRNNENFTNSYHNALGNHYHYQKKASFANKEFDKSIYYSLKLKDSILLNNSYFHTCEKIASTRPRYR